VGIMLSDHDDLIENALEQQKRVLDIDGDNVEQER